jgi:hypothetical protein
MPAPASALTQRPTVIGGDRLDDDWQVIWDGIPIGRILKAPGIPVGRPCWSWGVIFPHLPQHPWMRGMESDIDEAKRRFRVAWSDVHRRLTDADIDAARRQAVDNRKRWKER